ncbi:hypothetical protein MNKW57_20320 [Biformimicrobium ophioploci]|uniref:Secreted protein n=1 Tax=Biformimicrobium ophioploci TaxID=3036711 RepID=A0ABQ6M051_9GAMM|nr:hypothetical protein MNKW57_20320 [Microbulbifer sp. NKW57]
MLSPLTLTSIRGSDTWAACADGVALAATVLVATTPQPTPQYGQVVAQRRAEKTSVTPTDTLRTTFLTDQ